MSQLDLAWFVAFIIELFNKGKLWRVLSKPIINFDTVSLPMDLLCLSRLQFVMYLLIDMNVGCVQLLLDPCTSSMCINGWRMTWFLLNAR